MPLSELCAQLTLVCFLGMASVKSIAFRVSCLLIKRIYLGSGQSFVNC